MNRFPIVCMNYIKLLIGLLVLLMADVVLSADAASWRSAVVTHVTDADTLWVRDPSNGSKPVKLRIVGIDAPEICQAGGELAKAELQRLLRGGAVQYSATWFDDYGRALATVRVDGIDVGSWLVRRGLAWSYGFRYRPARYAREQALAVKEKRGVFAQEDPIEPRVFRRVHGECGHPARSNQSPSTSRPASTPMP